VARAANTGISAVIDPVGRTVAQLDLGIEGVLDTNLPAAIDRPFYARFGDLPVTILVLATLVIVTLRRLMTRAR